jgi:hypothetical protein
VGVKKKAQDTHDTQQTTTNRRVSRILAVLYY